ncbi:NAD kinase [Rhodococcus sp. BP-252]|uniref:NAD kinase n=1 Tax=unclassified Rhodococcus (in: high G+C Gram-positive bacteria) TaxID=192944 RepID=UPI001C9A6E45|nr:MULTISPECIES: NAD kinase [unclassified Rhodococcus (in: high G+C Gram-positive bacteria)]MBY6410277.1 NAD kinase [Rhodococcus sp. BP-320]MBY6415246.1 NAD kinase [Rhodococcus sp. BP-321]MBY6424254.1 NAD kinase [Rhodococcus sp. BP-324]MBY6429394.1 NAD kinase [Rhodococcus sp. BP-323]MBY6430142.1 NAD kinase [Rhodococcus sp. BP-322]
MTTEGGTSTVREILLVAHPGRPDIADTVRRVGKVLSQANIRLRVLVDEVDSSRIEPSGRDKGDDSLESELELRVVEFGPDAAVGCELVLVLGGDGTFLRAAELAKTADIPVLGINLGRIGFLAEAEADHLEDALARVVTGDYRVEDRMTLDIVVRAGERVVDRGWALNEASIENGSRLGVLEVVLEVDDRPVSAFGCDGVLISTPTGSTAYAFSAGGPVVWPELEAILVIPSNAHALFARPLVTSPESIIAVETVAGSHDGVVFCDGRRTLQLPAGGRVEVVRGASPIKWVRLDSAPFADRMVTKFALPITGWRGRAR